MNKVREIRKQKGMTQAELAEKCGFCRQTIINVERENLRFTQYWTMKCIAEALDCKVEDIFSL